jgi:N-carbamoyl-L-amino-acid hydrolase
MTLPRLSIDIERLSGELATLATFSDAPAPAVTRILWTERDLEARRYLISLFEEAGLEVRVDALGNTFARWPGTVEDGAIGTGSHTDAIPYSGTFDGTVGVLGGLEALRALKRIGFEPKRPLEVLLFTSEEPTRFGLGCLGSRALSRAWSADELRGLKDSENILLEEARQAAGFTAPLESVPLPEGYYAAFVELHIEQGPILEREGLPIGIVTAIAAPAALRVEFIGEGGHAGARLMPGRKDALLAGAELALFVDQAARGTGAIDTVGTTGVFQVHPGAVNSIPSRALLEIDVRDIDGERRDAVVAAIQAEASEIAARRGLEFTLEILNADPPAASGEAVVAAIEGSCRRLAIPYQKMVSRAYHDSLFMARTAPTGMIFIPCRDGISHRPDEYAKPEDIALGVEVLAGALAELSWKD